MQNDDFGVGSTSPYVPRRPRPDRSPTPAAVQRRRVLNRIAQQNHRKPESSVGMSSVTDVAGKGRRVKERLKDNSAASDGDQDDSKISTNPPPQSSHDVAKSRDISGTPTASPWYGWPHEAPAFGNDANTLIFDQDFTSMSLLFLIFSSSAYHME